MTLPERQLANAIRALAMDAVQAANSGHPGMPMGMADVATVLYSDYLKFDRDRFVLSAGHGSMLAYATLHLAGYAHPTMEEIRNFRQLNSPCAGHPENFELAGVETTTGPLGQGLATAVGMAIAERHLNARFGGDLVNHKTYVLSGDGCLMEGISQEAISLAGHLKLNHLIVLWDDNGISIDGHIEHWYTDDTAKRFEAYGWNVIAGVDGHDVVALEAAIQKAKASSDKPTLICCKTVIGKGSPNKAGTHDVHGAALGHDEVEATRKHMGWTHPAFEVPADIYAGWDAKTKGQGLETLWNNKFAEYKKAYPAEGAEFERRMKGELPANWKAHVAEKLAAINAKGETVATRKASQIAINALASALPEFLGGSADLTGSNLTNWEGCHPVRHGKPGNYISYGVREFGMAAIMNGMALHGGILPFGGTFLMFSEYSRNAIRMAALMKQRVIHVFTHDSIGLGEDGPTHQPVEQTATLRMTPNIDVWRPCDTVETLVGWVASVERTSGPTCHILSRQNLPFMARDAATLANIAKGGYVLRDAASARAVIIATGSEVELAVKAQEALAAEGIAVRVVSMPSTNTFDRQDAAYKASVLPRGLPRVAVEAGVTDFWRKYVGLEGAVIGIDSFGESAPAPALFKHFGITTEAVVAAVKGVL